MKRFILLSTLLFAMVVSAQDFSNDQAKSQFIFDGQYFQNESLSYKKVETVYEEKIVDAICEREETYYVEEWVKKTFVKEICTQLPSKKECKIVKGKLVCEVVPGKKICRDEEVTDTVLVPVEKKRIVKFPCKKKELVEVDVVKKKYIANIRFRFGYTSLYPEMMIDSELNDKGEVSVKATNLEGSSVILLASKTVNKRESKYFDYINVDYQITSFDKDALLAHISEKPSDIQLDRYKLDFEVPRVLFPQRAKFAVKITDLSTGRVLINRDLNEYEYRTYDSYYGDSTKVTVNDLRRMGVRVYNGRQYRVKVTSKVDIGELEMLNSDVKKLSASKSRRVRL